MKIAIVVQRFHNEIVGGCEAHARQYAELLSSSHEVDVVTTTSLSNDTWENALSPGMSTESGYRVLRFLVGSGRTESWHGLHELLLDYHRLQLDFQQRKDLTGAQSLNTPEDSFMLPLVQWSPALQEEWVKTQGPCSPDLLEYLQSHKDDYDRFLYFAYLYHPTYAGVQVTPCEKNFLVPTLHDEAAAYLSIFTLYRSRLKSFLWNTYTEKQFARRLWGECYGDPVAVGIELPLLKKEISNSFPYILYAGRMDRGKGCDILVDFFVKYKKEHKNSSLHLLLVGQGNYLPKRRKDLVVTGRVSEDELARLRSGALLFVMPSRMESLSIATLESMAYGLPVLINGESDVLLEHVGQSGGGWSYKNQEEFSRALDLAETNPGECARRGALGRQYVKEFYSMQSVKERLEKALRL